MKIKNILERLVANSGDYGTEKGDQASFVSILGCVNFSSYPCIQRPLDGLGHLIVSVVLYAVAGGKFT